MEEEYKALAERNNWNYVVEDGRPYFMKKDGGYAIPDENTTEEDKEMLAEAIAEGSSELAKLIITCWDNHIGISGPCSGILEYHPQDKPPVRTHFTIIASREIVEMLYNNMQMAFPDYEYLVRENSNGTVRFDIDYWLNGKVLTVEEADNIFLSIHEQLKIVLNMEKQNRY